MLPEFTAQGVLPPGLHAATFAEVSTRYGRFQRTDQRPRLLAVLEEFVGEVRQCRWVRRLFLAGSFVTANEEPHDIDVLLVFEHRAQFTALLPHEYNVLYQAGAQRRFGLLSISMWLRKGARRWSDCSAFFNVTAEVMRLA